MMSGGTFDYEQHRINDIIDTIKDAIEKNNKENEWGHATNFNKETVRTLERGIWHLQKAYIFAHRIDRLLSGDEGEENFLKRLKEDLYEPQDM